MFFIFPTGVVLFLGTGWITLSFYDKRSLFEMLTGRELERRDGVVEASASGA